MKQNIPMQEINLKDIKIKDDFWTKYQDLVR